MWTQVETPATGNTISMPQNDCSNEIATVIDVLRSRGPGTGETNLDIEAKKNTIDAAVDLPPADWLNSALPLARQLPGVLLVVRVY